MSKCFVLILLVSQWRSRVDAMTGRLSRLHEGGMTNTPDSVTLKLRIELDIQPYV